MALSDPGRCLWTELAPPTDYPPLPPTGTAVDVAIVGGGVVGLTTALLLKRAGRSAMVLEARRIGRQVTGRSTAKVTAQHGLIYADLARRHGTDAARAYAEANAWGVRQVGELVAELGIDCDFERKPAFVFDRTGERRQEIEAEADAARRLGLPASVVRETGLPFPVDSALRFDDQGQFDPVRYVHGLARAVEGGGCRVHELTRATGIEGGAHCRIETDRGTVSAQAAVIATNMPVGSPGMYWTKAFPRAHIAMAAEIGPERALDGMYLEATQPSHSLRTVRVDGRTWLVAIGASYKTGHPDGPEQVRDELHAFLRERFGIAEPAFCWANEDFDSMDRIPFVGRAAGAENLYVATGFGAWGFSNGTAAARIIADAILGEANPWAATFDARRTKPLAGGGKFVAENLHAGTHLAKDKLAGPARGDPEALAPGEAAVLQTDDGPVAAYRDASGDLRLLSAVCTHMGCHVRWNPVDRNWDCPCHGSRFEADGTVLNGPAMQPLQRKGG